MSPTIHLSQISTKLVVLLGCCLLSVSSAAQYTPFVSFDTVLPRAAYTTLSQTVSTGAVSTGAVSTGAVSWSGMTSEGTFTPVPWGRSGDTQTTARWTQTTLFKTVAAPALLATGGLLTFYDNRILDRYDVQEARQSVAPNFRIYADDFLIFSPIVAVYGLDAAGVKAQHRFLDRTVRMLTASALSQAIIIPIKHYTQVERPDGSDFESFPSGHTTQAFVGATFMHKELGHLSPWYSVGAYTTATALGVLRIMNNKHWLSDVLVGAGVGILSTNVAYLIFPDKGRPARKQGTSQIMMMPAYYQGSIGLNMLLVLH